MPLISSNSMCGIATVAHTMFQRIVVKIMILIIEVHEVFRRYDCSEIILISFRMMWMVEKNYFNEQKFSEDSEKTNSQHFMGTLFECFRSFTYVE